jgi:hypothetical protein
MLCPIQHDNSEILLDYCARKLNPETAVLLEKHIENCVECRNFANAQRLVWEALDTWDTMPVSMDFDRRLYARIEEHKHSNWWSKLKSHEFFQPFGWKPAVPLVTAGATFALAVWLILPMEKPVMVDQSGQIRAESVDLDQAERDVDDLEMLQQLAPAPAANRL